MAHVPSCLCNAREADVTHALLRTYWCHLHHASPDQEHPVPTLQDAPLLGGITTPHPGAALAPRGARRRGG